MDLALGRMCTTMCLTVIDDLIDVLLVFKCSMNCNDVLIFIADI